MDVDDYIHDGLANKDDVSCYANAAIQSLLALSKFRELIDKETTELNRQLVEIMQKKTRDCYDVRSLIGENFTSDQEQNVCEFLSEIMNMSNFLYENYVGLDKYYHCPSCGEFRKEKINLNLIMLEIPSTYQKKVNFNELFKYQPTEHLCKKCKLCTYEMALVLTNIRNLIFLWIKLRCDNSSKKVPTAFYNFDCDNLQFDHEEYEVKAAIIHHGELITTGHYTCVVRNKGRWLSCNDELVEEVSFDNTLQDVVVLILERKHHNSTML